jgi:hypothetical protein
MSRVDKGAHLAPWSMSFIRTLPGDMGTLQHRDELNTSSRHRDGRSTTPTQTGEPTLAPNIRHAVNRSVRPLRLGPCTGRLQWQFEALGFETARFDRMSPGLVLPPANAAKQYPALRRVLYGAHLDRWAQRCWGHGDLNLGVPVRSFWTQHPPLNGSVSLSPGTRNGRFKHHAGGPAPLQNASTDNHVATLPSI